MLQLLKLFGAFFKRDLLIETSYRISFLINFGSIFFGTFTFFFVSRIIDQTGSAFLEPYGGDYFSFVLIGIAFSAYFGVGLKSFASAIRRAQTTGTLEAMMMTPTPVSLIILSSAVWPYMFTTIRVIAYLLTGVALGVRLPHANYPAAILSLLLSLIAFAGIGIIAASVIMVVKRGDPVTALVSNIATLVGGVFYPVTVLPGWLQSVAKAMPLTYSLNAMRAALLQGATWSELQPDLTALALFCIVLIPTSLFLFKSAVERARADGSLAHY